MLDLARVESERVDDIVVARIYGEVDISNAGEVSTQLHAAFGNAHRHAIVDLSETSYLDSIGIRLLFTLAESLRDRRQELHVVVPPNSLLLRLLELVDFARAVQVHPDVASAMRAN